MTGPEKALCRKAKPCVELTPRWWMNCILGHTWRDVRGRAAKSCPARQPLQDHGSGWIHRVFSLHPSRSDKHRWLGRWNSLAALCRQSPFPGQKRITGTGESPPGPAVKLIPQTNLPDEAGVQVKVRCRGVLEIDGTIEHPSAFKEPAVK